VSTGTSGLILAVTQLRRCLLEIGAAGLLAAFRRASSLVEACSFT
jgi:hypothetical protein